MFEKLSDNLNLLMAKARINASELARKTGIPASTIKKIRNRNNPNPTLTTLLPIAQCFAVTVSQLIGDETLPTGNAEKSSQKSIPLLSWKQAIHWPNENAHLYLSLQHPHSDKTFALKVEDEDWQGFTKESLLLIDPHEPVEHRDFVIVHKEGQEISSLRQVLYDEETIYLKPVINGYNITPFSSQHQLLGVVMECRKYLKTRKE